MSDKQTKQNSERSAGVHVGEGKHLFSAGQGANSAATVETAVEVLQEAKKKSCQSTIWSTYATHGCIYIYVPKTATAPKTYTAPKTPAIPVHYVSFHNSQETNNTDFH